MIKDICIVKLLLHKRFQYHEDGFNLVLLIPILILVVHIYIYIAAAQIFYQWVCFVLNHWVDSLWYRESCALHLQHIYSMICSIRSVCACLLWSYLWCFTYASLLSILCKCYCRCTSLYHLCNWSKLFLAFHTPQLFLCTEWKSSSRFFFFLILYTAVRQL